MFLMLYLFSLILGGLSSLTQCDQGYISSDGCESSVLVHQIFSGTDEQLAFGDANTDLDLGPNGYAIRNYFVPIDYYNRWNAHVYNMIYVDDYAPAYGFSAVNWRNPIVWNSLLETVDSNLDWINYLSFNIRGMPTANGANRTINAPNEVQFVAQQETLVDLLESPTADTCPMYNEDTLIGSSTTPNYEVLQQFGEIYSDGAFACPECTPTPQFSKPDKIFFNGTMWTPRYSGADSQYCNSMSCAAYPYAYVDYIDSGLYNKSQYLPYPCPMGVNYYSKSATTEQDTTLQAMTYFNLLSNSLLDPFLTSTFAIQGGYTQYGELYFDAQTISEGQAFWMVLIGMMLMNGFWPMAGADPEHVLCISPLYVDTITIMLCCAVSCFVLSIAVWRAGHERAFGLVDMMNTGTIQLFPMCFLIFTQS